MGLDQYASARKGEPTTIEEPYTVTLEDGTTEEHIEYSKEWADSYDLADWRKHPNLQGFMEDKWCGEGEFNCVDLELTLEDIDELEETINGAELPETGGFFFGSDSDEYYKEQDLEFCADARKALKDGYTVIYSSWW
jgi:hypothetical protein|tara:strand:- start:721 stop:1131 length:411 start_codon:yes stop_codon:yes gene_type:complete